MPAARAADGGHRGGSIRLGRISDSPAERHLLQVTAPAALSARPHVAQPPPRRSAPSQSADLSAGPSPGAPGGGGAEDLYRAARPALTADVERAWAASESMSGARRHSDALAQTARGVATETEPKPRGEKFRRRPGAAACPHIWPAAAALWEGGSPAAGARSAPVARCRCRQPDKHSPVSKWASSAWCRRFRHRTNNGRAPPTALTARLTARRAAVAKSAPASAPAAHTDRQLSAVPRPETAGSRPNALCMRLTRGRVMAAPGKQCTARETA